MSAITRRAKTSNLQRLTAALLVVSAVLFVIGIVFERAGPAGDVHTEAPPVATQVTGTPVENGNESGEAHPQATGSAPSPEAQGEATFGFNLENPWLERVPVGFTASPDRFPRSAALRHQSALTAER